MPELGHREALVAYDARPADRREWPDAWLVEGVCSDPLNETSLDALARRHWKGLFGRCRMLTLNDEDAADLAQSAWCRVLRARRSLDPNGNFPAYLAMVATNLWRDEHRTARRAGPMAEHRLASLDAPLANEDGNAATLAELLPDLHTLSGEAQALLAVEIDRALARLTPRLRDVLVARHLHGESAADIAKRHGRSEQAVSAWVRQAIGEMQLHLGSSPHAVTKEDRR